MPNYALVRGGIITNVALVHPTPDGLAYLAAVEADYDEVVLIEAASPGQYIADGVPIPRPALTADVPSIAPDGATPAVVTYTNHEPTAPLAVDFTVNGSAPSTVALTDGAAAVEVTSATPGDTITVTAGGLSAVLEVTE